MSKVDVDATPKGPASLVWALGRLEWIDEGLSALGHVIDKAAEELTAEHCLTAAGLRDCLRSLNDDVSKLMEDLHEMEGDPGWNALVLPKPTTGDDAALLALEPEYDRLQAERDAQDASDEWEDAFDATGKWKEDAGKAADDFAMQIIAMPRAKTPAGKALKARAALHHLAYIEDGGTATTACRTVLTEAMQPHA